MAVLREQRVEFRPAWDRRDDDQTKNYGVNGVEIHFSVIGPLGAISWFIFTPWVLPKTREWWKTLPVPPRIDPIAGPVAWHERRDEGEDCHLVGKCKGRTVGSLTTDEILEALIAEGDAGVWKILEEQYEQQVKPLLM